MKTKYEPVKKHYKHPVYIQYGNYGPHRAKIMCKLCNEFIKWANEKEINILQEINYGKTNQLRSKDH